MSKWIIAALALAFAAPAAAQDAPARGVPADATSEQRLRQAGAEVLFWSQQQRDANFPHMEDIFPARVVEAGEAARLLPQGEPLPIPADEIDAFIAAQNIAGLIVLQDGRVRLERYARGFDAEGRWTSFSVAKSFTSTLVGAAIADGSIESLDDPVTRYIPELVGSAYDGVTVAQLLTMTSGVAWNEDYTDPNSDVARMLIEPVPEGADPTVHYMRKLEREAAPGTKWRYKTGETNLIGVLVRNATGKTLADYLSDRVWKPYGMETDAVWMVDTGGNEISGCCLSVSLRDYARFGQFVLDGGEGVVPDGWFADATRSHADVGRPGFGYGYQWWTYPQGVFGAQGIFGQTITIDPERRVVVAMVGAWPVASQRELWEARLAFSQRLIVAAGE